MLNTFKYIIMESGFRSILKNSKYVDEPGDDLILVLDVCNIRFYIVRRQIQFVLMVI